MSQKEVTKEYTFDGQRDGEDVILVVAKHAYTMYRPGTLFILLTLISFVIIVFWPKLFFLPIVIMLVALVYIYNAYFSYRESMLIITSQRIFSIEQKGFFQRKVTQVDLYKIIDVTSETNGLLRSMLKFGNLVVRTVGAKEGGDIIATNIPTPYYVQQVIAGIDTDKNKERYVKEQ